jgi:hypothetical protein
MNFKSIAVAAGATAGGLALLTFGIASTADAAQPSTGPQLVTTQAEFSAEYSAGLARLPFAFPETSADLARNAATTVPQLGDAFAEVGVAENTANLSWLCSWEREYLEANAAQDSIREATAVDALGKWTSIPWVAKHFIDPGQDWTKDVLTPAQNGDPTGVQQDFLNCG